MKGVGGRVTCVRWDGVRGTSTEAALSANAARAERDSLLALGRTSALSPSFLQEYIMAREHVRQLGDKLKQDVSVRQLL